MAKTATPLINERFGNMEILCDLLCDPPAGEVITPPAADCTTAPSVNVCNLGDIALDLQPLIDAINNQSDYEYVCAEDDGRLLLSDPVNGTLNELDGSPSTATPVKCPNTSAVSLGCYLAPDGTRYKGIVCKKDEIIVTGSEQYIPLLGGPILTELPADSIPSPCFDQINERFYENYTCYTDGNGDIVKIIELVSINPTTQVKTSYGYYDGDMNPLPDVEAGDTFNCPPTTCGPCKIVETELCELVGGVQVKFIRVKKVDVSNGNVTQINDWLPDWSAPYTVVDEANVGECPPDDVVTLTVDTECSEDTGNWDYITTVITNGVAATPTHIDSGLPCTGDAPAPEKDYVIRELCDPVSNTITQTLIGIDTSDDSETVLQTVDTGIECNPCVGTPTMFKSKKIMIGVENSKTRFSNSYLADFTLNNGEIRTVFLPSAANWGAQMVGWEAALAAAFPELCEVKRHWADWKASQLPQNGTATIDQTDMVGENSTLPPLVGQYIQFTACPDELPFLPVDFKFIERNDLPWEVQGVYSDIVETPVEYIKVCLSCGDCPDGEIPKCAIPASSSFPETPVPLATFNSFIACDNGTDPNTEIIVLVSITDGVQTIEYFTDDGNGNLEDYTLVGTRVDCESGEEIVIPEPEITLEDLIVKVECKPCAASGGTGCIYTAEFKSSGITSLLTDAGEAVTNGPHDFTGLTAGQNASNDPLMAAAEADINAFLAANGGGTVTLEYLSQSILTVTVTGPVATIISVDDNSNPGPHSFTKTGECSTTGDTFDALSVNDKCLNEKICELIGQHAIKSCVPKLCRTESFSPSSAEAYHTLGAWSDLSSVVNMMSFPVDMNFLSVPNGTPTAAGQYRFDLSSIPAGCEVKKVTAKIGYYGLADSDPDDNAELTAALVLHDGTTTTGLLGTSIDSAGSYWGDFPAGLPYSPTWNNGTPTPNNYAGGLFGTLEPSLPATGDVNREIVLCATSKDGGGAITGADLQNLILPIWHQRFLMHAKLVSVELQVEYQPCEESTYNTESKLSGCTMADFLTMFQNQTLAIVAALSGLTSGGSSDACEDNDKTLAMDSAGIITGAGAIPAGFKSVTINSISGINTIDGNFEIGTGRRVDSISFGTDRGNCVNELLPAIAITGTGRWQWIGLR